MKRLAQTVVRRRGWVLGTWLLVFAALLPRAARIERELDVAARVRHSEAAAVERTLAERFDSPFARFAVLVVTGVPGPHTAAGREVLRALVVRLDSVPGVRGTFSYLDTRDTLFVGAGGVGMFLFVGLDPPARSPDTMVPMLRAVTERIGAELRSRHPDITLRWTGEIPLNFDLRGASVSESRSAERRVLPLTLLLLLLAFGAVVAALLPLVAGALAIIITLGAAALINSVWPLSIMLQNTVSMIGLGVGIDYALLTVNRFREALAEGRDPEAAAVEAAEHAGVTIALSGAAVMIGFAALLLVPLNELQAIGVGGMVVVGVSVLMAATLLPGLLAWFGPRIDAGRIFRRRAHAAGNPLEKRWRAWGRWVIAHPWLVLIAAGTPVLLLAWEARRLRPELPRGNWLPRQIESARALEDLARMERNGVVNTLRVVLELPVGSTVLDTSGWSAVRRVTEAVGRESGIARVQSLTTIIPSERPSDMLLALVPPSARRSLLTADGRAVVLEVVPHDTVDFNDLTALARRLRELEPARVGALPGTTLRVGGMPAFNADYVDAITARFSGLVALVVLSTLGALVLGFRSVLVPVKALALNLLSVAAAFGAVVLVFQDGYGVQLLGLDGPLHGVFPAVPVLVFCVVFGLSMDYEVFLIARVAEARRRAGDDEAIVEGLARTGGVITSAAAIMIVVFAAFTLGEFLFIKVLGFALAVAVLLDATLMRVAIGPALLKLAGRWNWWPGQRTASEQRRQSDGVVRPATSGA
jgi:RND superfamily putative drug exporter